MKATIITTDTHKTIELDTYYTDISGHVHPYDIDADMCNLIQYESPYRDDDGIWHMSEEDADWWVEYADIVPEVYGLERQLTSEGRATWDELEAIADECGIGLVEIDGMRKYLGKLRNL